MPSPNQLGLTTDSFSEQLKASLVLLSQKRDNLTLNKALWHQHTRLTIRIQLWIVSRKV